MALSFYQQALSYMPGKKTIMTRCVLLDRGSRSASDN